MKIVEYNDVNPHQAMFVAILALDFPMTPEHVAYFRQTDPRPFPCLAVYAVDDEEIMGQVGIFRLPMITTEGREDVGGIWAVSTHPQYSGRGVASALIEEAHTRMREAGLRFSTLGTDQFRVAHKLYRKHGYVETNVWGTALARWETAHQPTRLRAETLGSEGYPYVEQIYQDISKDYLGFAWRYTPFSRLRRVNLTDIWILRENSEIAGYALTKLEQSIFTISNLVLRQGVDAAEAVAAVITKCKADYVQVRISRPVEIASFKHAGYHVAHPDWLGFMVKPLVPDVTYEDARQLFGICTDRFLISWLDVT
jgi:GNAT superfamily N-acetyltransferase